MCILNNDMQLQKLGLNRTASLKGLEIERQLKYKSTGQESLF